MKGLVQCIICHTLIGCGELYLARGKPMIQLSKENRFFAEGYRHAIVQHGLTDNTTEGLNKFIIILSSDGNKEEITED